MNGVAGRTVIRSASIVAAVFRGAKGSTYKQAPPAIAASITLKRPKLWQKGKTARTLSSVE